MKKQPKTYELKTFRDICECVTNENLDNFLVDLKNVLLHTNLIKAANGGNLDGVDLDTLTWVDDGKNDLDFALESP